MYGAWLALCLGLLLLFAAILAWVDFRQILKGKNRQDSMAEFIVIGKKITNENMGFGQSQNHFSSGDIRDIRQLKNVKAVGKISANQFPVTARMGGSLGFSTELFLESIDNTFLDELPSGWQWQPGENTLPVILSNDFLNLYNYGFALSQGYPQLSQKSIQALPFRIIIAGGKEKFNAQIVGFTDRISSVLVPENFMLAMNAKYGHAGEEMPSRLILKVKDPSDKAFVSMLQKKDYTVNSDQLRWSRIRTAVQAIVSVVGLVALLIVGMAVLSFILFLEITVYRAAGAIRLLKQIGYAPAQLRKVLNRFFLPWMGSAVLIAALAAFALHILLAAWVKSMGLSLEIPIASILIFPLLLFLPALYFLLQSATKAILKKV
jgi:hypothetical protein